ncbi:MAG TPA: hypothetical protein VMJ64_12110 [Anaerolineales bacterium]|nr:hypothetical protein [Anaerolineales bacterium]
MTEESTVLTRLNRPAVISLIAAFFTALSFCIAVAPIPFTGWFCYPAAAFLGTVALITGWAALIQLGHTAEAGRAYAVIGITVGALALLGSACAMALWITLLPHILAAAGRIIHWAISVGQNIVRFLLNIR